MISFQVKFEILKQKNQLLRKNIPEVKKKQFLKQKRSVPAIKNIIHYDLILLNIDGMWRIFAKIRQGPRKLFFISRTILALLFSEQFAKKV